MSFIKGFFLFFAVFVSLWGPLVAWDEDIDPFTLCLTPCWTEEMMECRKEAQRHREERNAAIGEAAVAGVITCIAGAADEVGAASIEGSQATCALGRAVYHEYHRSRWEREARDWEHHKIPGGQWSPVDLRRESYNGCQREADPICPVFYNDNGSPDYGGCICNSDDWRD